LLECGADVDAQTDNSSTPLHMAALSERIEVVRVLLKHGAESGVQNEEGKTADITRSWTCCRNMPGRGA
jgi:ankyrin repeat protein